MPINQTDRNEHWPYRWKDAYVLVSLVFTGSIGLGVIGTWFPVSILQISLPDQIIAGFTEPITTKLLPAFVVLWIYKFNNLNISYLRCNAYKPAFVGGLSLGLAERFLYIVVNGASVTPVFLLAALIHAINSTLVAGAVFSAIGRFESYLFLIKLMIATVTAIVIHVFWNGWGVIIVYQFFS